ncbi:MAG: DNA primase small subunit domain-containing protein, partial [Candidatus Woesearchaeota archaeon]
PLNVTLSYYKRRDIQEEMIRAAKNREIAVKFDDKFGSRPDVLNNPNDVLELAKQKATSFHASEELWRNPLQLNLNMKKHEIADLRTGWDLVLDIDCSFYEYSKIAADLVIKALKFNDVKSTSCKFSGNKGFHIGVPFEAFPEKIRNDETKNMFPDAARRIAYYIKELIKKPLGEKIMQFEKNDFSRIVRKTNENPEKIKYYEKNKYGTNIPHLNAEPFLNIDTILISSRHLFRMPYSLHEKSGLVSLPLDPEDVLKFKKEDADPKNAKVSKFRFLDKEDVTKGDAKKLIMQAFDFSSKREDEINAETKKDYEIKDAMPETFFPPCVESIRNGLADGRKRALFVLINFLTSLGWGYKEIEDYLKEWNKKNTEPIRENYLLGQLRYHKTQKKKILPPNCNNNMYYVDIGACKPDNLCSKIKNPVSYAIRKSIFSRKDIKNKK